MNLSTLVRTICPDAIYNMDIDMCSIYQDTLYVDMICHGWVGRQAQHTRGAGGRGSAPPLFHAAFSAAQHTHTQCAGSRYNRREPERAREGTQGVESAGKPLYSWW